MSWTKKLSLKTPRPSIRRPSANLSLRPGSGQAWLKRLKGIFPNTLRSRLILGFSLTIFLSLLLAGTATIYLLRAERERTAQEKVGRLAPLVGLQEAMLEARGVTAPSEIQAALQEEFGVRILLVDRDRTVVGDSQQTLRGQQISALAEQGLGARPLSDLRYNVQRYRRGPENVFLFSSPKGVFATSPGAGPFGFLPQYQAVIAVAASDISGAWEALLPRLLIAGGIALAIGVVIAVLLAQSITRPLQHITLASEQMAIGRYDQQLRDYGGEEVSRLTSAFNLMARQVSRSHRTLREFLANVSHELKTPLTSIQGFSQAMTDGSLRSQADYVEAGTIINEEAIRMRGLVDDLLYLSQVEAGQAVLQLDDVSSTDLLVATRDRFRRRAQQTGVDLVVEAGANVMLHVDPRRIEQAVANLTDNAIRHTPAGGRVRIGTKSAAGSLTFFVHNTGSYIPPEVVPLIFDRFFQVDPARARADGNTGLGLAITKEIVEAHSGRVEVQSDRATGTLFSIVLPVGDASPSRDRADHLDAAGA